MNTHTCAIHNALLMRPSRQTHLNSAATIWPFAALVARSGWCRNLKGNVKSEYAQNNGSCFKRTLTTNINTYRLDWNVIVGKSKGLMSPPGTVPDSMAVWALAFVTRVDPDPEGAASRLVSDARRGLRYNATSPIIGA